MTQSQTQNQNLTEGLNRIRRWRDQYRSMQPPSPLEDVNQLAAKLEMTHAHPSGIAQLFASGHVRLDSLFRDTGVLKAAERHIGRVLDDQAAKRRISGVAELSLVVGVATWKGNALPVLLYPVSVTIEDDGLSTTIRFTGRVTLNAAFVNALREQGVFLDEDSLFDGASYDSGTPETSAMFARISSEASERISDFAIERQIVLGCFMDPSSQMISESRQFIDQLENGPTGNVLLLNSKIAFKNGFRAIFFIPYTLSVLVIGYVFKYIFMNPLPELGKALGIKWLSTSLLTNEQLSWIPIVFLAVWQGIAYSVLIYLAGLQTIDDEIYEAAAIDGVNAWQKFWKITFPLIGPFFTINLVLSMKNALGTFDQVVALTEGGPNSSTETVTYLIWKGGLTGGEYAYQTANAVLFFIVLAIIAFVQLRISRSQEQI